jgi:hypothetical protein
MKNMVDKLYEDDLKIIREIMQLTRAKNFSAPSYSVLYGDENEIILNTGSDIIDADNVCSFLNKKFNTDKFYISNEYISIGY